jgi:hypothetical protein
MSFVVKVSDHKDMVLTLDTVPKRFKKKHRERPYSLKATRNQRVSPGPLPPNREGSTARSRPPLLRACFRNVRHVRKFSSMAGGVIKHERAHKQIETHVSTSCMAAATEKQE